MRRACRPLIRDVGTVCHWIPACRSRRTDVVPRTRRRGPSLEESRRRTARSLSGACPVASAAHPIRASERARPRTDAVALLDNIEIRDCGVLSGFGRHLHPESPSVARWRLAVLAVAIFAIIASACGGGSSTSTQSSPLNANGASGAPARTVPLPSQEPVSQAQKGLARDPYTTSFHFYIFYKPDGGVVPDSELSNIYLSMVDHSSCTEKVFQGNAAIDKDQHGTTIYSVNPAFTALPWPCVVLSNARWTVHFTFKGSDKVVTIDLKQDIGTDNYGNPHYTLDCADLLPIPVDCEDFGENAVGQGNLYVRIWAERAPS